VGDSVYPPILYSVGDVKDGVHELDSIAIGPIPVPKDATPVVITFSIVNSGDTDGVKKDVQFTLDSFADAGANMSYAFGTLINRFLMFPLHAFEFSSCDGIVVTDAVGIYGQTAAALTRAGRRYSETRRYPGRLNIFTPEYNAIYPSPGSCGETSDYSITWTIENVEGGAGQRELEQYGYPVVGMGGYADSEGVEHIVLALTGPLDPRHGILTSLSMSGADGRKVHSLVDPIGSLETTPTALSAWETGGAEQHSIIGDAQGGLYFTTTSTSHGGTTIEAVPLPTVPGITAVAGFYPNRALPGTDIGVYANHMFIGMSDGTIRYIVRGDTPDSWSDRGLVNIGAGRRIVGLAAFFSDRDGCGHLIAALNDGDIVDLRVSSDAAVEEPTFLDVRANISNPVAVAALTDGAGGYHRIYVASADGSIHEIWYPGVAAAGQGGVCTRAHFDSIQAMTAYYTDSDSHHHLVVAATDSRIREFVWRN
jgi:hypothetical protein